MSSEYLSASEAAREVSKKFKLDIRPRDISMSIYTGRLDERRCPLIAGRRHVPKDFLPEIAEKLRGIKRRPRKEGAK